MPKVSVIIPTFDSEKTISRAIKSVLNQTFQDFELIVIDDASKDHTVEIVKEWQKREQRIKLFILNKNSGGPALPRNIGIQKAKGEYIAFLDSDDMYLPENLEIKSKILNEKPEIDMVVSWSWGVEEKTKRIINYLPPYTLSWLVRKKIFERIGYFKEEESGADEIGFSLRYRRTKKNFNGIFIIKEPLTLYFWRSDQASKNLREKSPLFFAKKWESLLQETNDSEVFKEARFTIFSRLGNLYCLGGDFKKGRVYFKKALSLKFHYLPFVLFFISFFGRNYKKIERLLRSLHHSIIWGGELFLARLKYLKNYKMAIEFLKEA